MSIRRYRCRHVMIVFQFYQSMDKFPGMVDMFAYNVHQTYAINCTLLDCCNALADPIEYEKKKFVSKQCHLKAI